MISTIPFAGFYNTWHDQLLDDALDQMLSDSSGDPNKDLVNHAYFAVNWTEAHLRYAEAYATEWLALHGITGKFDELRSPREYNFTTDRIFVDVPLEEVKRIFDETPPGTLGQVAHEMFTSRSGFISFYSNDFHTWGDVEDWDHNQVGCLMAAYALECGVMPENEDELMERYRDNGYLEDWVCNTKAVQRVAKIAWYLREREDRKWRFLTPPLGGKLEAHVP